MVTFVRSSNNGISFSITVVFPAPSGPSIVINNPATILLLVSQILFHFIIFSSELKFKIQLKIENLRVNYYIEKLLT